MFGRLFCKNTTLLKSGFFLAFTDYHCHILPGVDDGVKTLEETLRILTFYEELGIRNVWCTPHIMEDMPNTIDCLNICFNELKSAYHGSVQLHLAAENMLDNLFVERLAANDVLPVGNEGQYLLVETSYFNPPVGFRRILQDIFAKGYYPLLAHPERYRYMEQCDYQELKAMGVKFQLNLPSLLGMYGNTALLKAEYLLKARMYDVVGTDIHRFNQFSKLIDSNIKLQYVQALNNLSNLSV